MEFASHRPKSAMMQKTVLELLCSVGSAAVKEICYYTGASTATVNRLEKLGYITLSERPVLRCREIRPAKLDGPLVLNQEQQQAFEGLSAQMDEEKPGVALLHGITGSGKTAVYLQLIRACLEAPGPGKLTKALGITGEQNRSRVTDSEALWIGDDGFRCETVTEGEIVATLSTPIPPMSVNGVKRRVGAGMGRCQGGFCAPRVMEIISRELGVAQTDLTKSGGDSRLLVGHTKEVR